MENDFEANRKRTGVRKDSSSGSETDESRAIKRKTRKLEFRIEENTTDASRKDLRSRKL